MKNLPIKTIVFAVLLTLAISFSAAAQGGKAMPGRIEFKKGASSAVVSDTLRNTTQAEYIFAAKKGQIVALKVSSTPRTDRASFSVFGDNFEYASEKVNYDLTFTAPETGDYVVWVQRPPKPKAKSTRYTLTLKIKS